MQDPKKIPNMTIHQNGQDLLDNYLGRVEKILVQAQLTELEVDNLIVDIFHSILDLSTKYLPPQGPYLVTRTILQKVLEELGTPEDVARSFLDEYQSTTSMIQQDLPTQPREPKDSDSLDSIPPHPPVINETPLMMSNHFLVKLSMRLPQNAWAVIQYAITVLVTVSISILSMLLPSMLDAYLEPQYYQSRFEEFLLGMVLLTFVVSGYLTARFISFYSILLKSRSPPKPNDSKWMTLQKLSDGLILFNSLIFFWFVFSLGSMAWTQGNSSGMNLIRIILEKLIVFTFLGFIILAYLLMKVLDPTSPQESWQRFKSLKNANFREILDIFTITSQVNSKITAEQGKKVRFGLLHRLFRYFQLLLAFAMIFPIIFAILYPNLGVATSRQYWSTPMGFAFLFFMIPELLIRYNLITKEDSLQKIESSEIEKWMHVVNILAHSVGFLSIALTTGTSVLPLLIIGADLLWLQNIYAQIFQKNDHARYHKKAFNTHVTRESTTTPINPTEYNIIRTDTLSMDRLHQPRPPMSGPESAIPRETIPRPESIIVRTESTNQSPHGAVISDVMGSIIKSLGITVFYSVTLLFLLTALVYEILSLWIVSPAQLQELESFKTRGDPITSILPIPFSILFGIALALQFILLVMIVYHRVTARPLSVSLNVMSLLMIPLALVPMLLIAYGYYMMWTYQYLIYLRVPFQDYLLFAIGSFVFAFLMMLEKRQIKSIIRAQTTSRGGKNDTSLFPTEQKFGH